MENQNFLVRIFYTFGLCEEDGQPSSKRILGAGIVLYTMVLYAMNPTMQWEFLVTWLSSGLIPFGITGFEKFRPSKPVG